MTHSHWVWTQHLFMTVGQSLVPIIRHRGPIDRLSVSVDRFRTTPEFAAFAQQQLIASFGPSGYFRQRIEELESTHSGIDSLQSLLKVVDQGYRVPPESLSLNLNLSGPLNGIATMVRRARLQDHAAISAWDVLKSAYKDRSDIVIDTGKVFRQLASTPWSVFQNDA